MIELFDHVLLLGFPRGQAVDPFALDVDVACAAGGAAAAHSFNRESRMVAQNEHQGKVVDCLDLVHSSHPIGDL
jgi:hypothetical protein